MRGEDAVVLTGRNNITGGEGVLTGCVRGGVVGVIVLRGCVACRFMTGESYCDQIVRDRISCLCTNTLCTP